MFTKNTKFLIGNPTYFNLEHRVYNMFLLGMIILMPIVSILNYIIGLSYIAFLLPIPWLLIYLGAYYHSIHTKTKDQLFSFVVLISYILLAVITLASGGITGPSPAFFLLAIFILLIQSQSSAKLLLVNFAFLVLTAVIEFNFPSIVQHYPSREIWITDVVVTYTGISIMMTFAVVFYKKEIIKQILYYDKNLQNSENRIQRISNILRSAEGETSILIEKVLEEATNILSMECGYITEYIKDNHQFVITRIVNKSTINLYEGYNFDYTTSYGQFAFEKAGFASNYNSQDLLSKSFLETNKRFGVKRWFSIPLWKGEQKFGAIVFLSSQDENKDFYTDSDQDFMLFIANWISNMLNTLKEQVLLEKANHEMSVLINMLKVQEEEIKNLAIVADQTSSYVIVTNANKIIEWANPAFIKKSGYKLSELIGQSPGTLLQGELTNPADIEKIRIGLVSKKPFRTHIKNYYKNGESYWNDLNITPVFDNNNTITRYIAISNDDTNRIEQQNKLKVAYDTMQALTLTQQSLINNEDPKNGISDGLELLGKATKVDRAYYFEIKPDEDTRVMLASIKSEWNSGLFSSELHNENNNKIPITELKDYYDLLSQNKVFTANMNNYTSSMKDNLFYQQRIQSIILAPVFIDKQFVGYVGLDSCKEIREWHESEIAALQLFSIGISSALKRFEEQKLAQKLSYLAKETKNGITIMNENGIVEWVNNGFESMTGYTEQELIGETTLLRKTSYDVNLYKPTLKYIMDSIQTKADFSTEFCLRTKSGEQRWLFIEGRYIKNDKNTSKYITESIDITTKKNAQDLIFEQSKQFMEIAFVQSHEFKGPLARIIGLTNLFEFVKSDDKYILDLIDKMKAATAELNTHLSIVVNLANQYDHQTSGYNFKNNKN